MPPSRIALANLPTPLEKAERLTASWGGPTIWIKRDDLTGFGLSGNKVRKLEYHLAAALDQGADTVVTCGAVQSNHCRATALAAAKMGLKTVLYLRSPDGKPPAAATGNHFLQRLAGAECRFITSAEYDQRNEIMETAAADLGSAWVIPEGASDALGAQGFVAAMHEIAPQLEALGIEQPIMWHASSSAGTTTGMVRGAAEAGLNVEIIGSSVGDTAAEVTNHVRGLLADSENLYGPVNDDIAWRITDEYVGRGYGLTTRAELATQVEATRLTGLIFDPAYTGKLIYGLKREIEQGRFTTDDSIVFWHTGGGFAALAYPDLLNQAEADRCGSR
jgi:D-cysteine desulfhydrase